MNIRTTVDYFQLPAAVLQEVRNEYGYTKEDCLLLDDGLEVKFFETKEGLADFIDWFPTSPYYRSLEVKAILQTVEGRYSLVLD